MKLVRIEHLKSGHGMWHTLCEKTGKPLVSFIDNEVMANLPMPDDQAVYGEHGRRWYSAADTWEMMHYWFSDNDIKQLIGLGFGVYELEAEEYKYVGKEVVFTKESMTVCVNITDKFLNSH